MIRDSEDIEYLQEQLFELHIDKDTTTAKKLLKQVLQAASFGVDTLPVFPAVAKLLASNDLVVKKLASWYVGHHGNHPDFVLLVINTLLKDCRDANPVIRGLAIRTLSGITLPAVAEYCLPPVSSGLEDPSAYVRRAAVTACVKLYRVAPDSVLEAGWVDILYAMIRDADPIIVANCVCVLEEVLKPEGGMVVNRNIARHLLNKLDKFSDWQLVSILRVLKKYRPRNEDETLNVLNIADSHLKSTNISVALETLQFFLILIRDMPHLKNELYSRVQPQINQFMRTDNPELLLLLLEFLEGILHENRSLNADYKSFFCRYNEPPYLKEKKIALLPSLTKAENVTEVVDELSMYCSDTVASVAIATVRAIGLISRNHPETVPTTIQKLLDLLTSNPRGIAHEILLVLQTLDLGQATNLPDALETITQALDLNPSDTAIIAIIGDYGDKIDNAPYLLEEQLVRLEEWDSGDVMDRVLAESLLTALCKLFLRRPAECQELLGRVMEVCVQSGSIELRDRILFYYQLLRTDLAEARRVLLEING